MPDTSIDLDFTKLRLIQQVNQSDHPQEKEMLEIMLEAYLRGELEVRWEIPSLDMKYSLARPN